MYSALGSESAFRDGLFSQAAPPQGFQRSVREYADGALGHAYRDGSLGHAYRDGSLGATVMPVPLSVLQRKKLLAAVRRFQIPRPMQGFGAEAVPVPTPAASGPNWPLIIGGGAALAVAAVVMMSGKKKR